MDSNNDKAKADNSAGLSSEWKQRLESGLALPASIVLTFLLGFIAAALPLAAAQAAGTIPIGAAPIEIAAWVFGLSLALLLIASLVELAARKKAFWLRWGLCGLLLFGFGLGALTYNYRAWLGRRWVEDDPLLAGMFLLGVIIGFFVVRNWRQSQEDFLKSMGAALAGAGASGVLGTLIEEGSASGYFRNYFIGFAVSGAINLLVSSLLLAYYTNWRSLGSRAVLSFLYGNDKAKAVDESFQENFKENKDSAKVLLMTTLDEYKKTVLKEFAEKLEAQRNRNQQKREQSKQEDDKRRKLATKEQELNERRKAIEDKEKEFTEETPAQERAAQLKPLIDRKSELEREVTALAAEVGGFKTEELRSKIGEREAELRLPGEVLDDAKKIYIYQLTSVGGVKGTALPSDLPTKEEDKNEYQFFFKEITKIEANMFRMGIMAEWQKTLEYLVAPGQYRQSFPLSDSVAGLALRTRSTIVMDRDQDKRFRTSDFKDGKTPLQARQRRGLTEIDFLSFISVPVVSGFRTPQERDLGVVNIDTKLFAHTKSPEAMEAKRVGAEWMITCTRTDLAEWGVNLYDQAEDAISYLEEMRAVVVPVLALYLICRQGAS